MVEVTKNPAEERALQGVLAMLELEQGRNGQALAHFAKADPESAYDLFYTAVAQERNGDKVEAARLYAKVATWNQNDLGYAVVRAQERGPRPRRRREPIPPCKGRDHPVPARRGVKGA